jgi:FAD/FMN-containing dehydrogenase
MTLTARDAFQEKKQRLSAALRSGHGGRLRLGKRTSNLFRDRKALPAQHLDVRAFNQVLNVDAGAGRVEVEGMTSYARLVDACLGHGVMPAVVPQLKSITIGGAVAGCGIESSSFRYGLVHETVQEMEVLLGDGSTVLCTPENEHRDLFRGFANSYGTLGYALRVTAAVVPVRRYVRIACRHFTAAERFFAELERTCERADVDFVDGVIFGRNELVLVTGRFTDTAPYTSDYTYEHIFYRSLRERSEDFLTTADYLWRWDTDWFWCSKNLLAQHPLVRRWYGRKRLNSVTYTKLMRWNSRWKITRALDRLRGLYSESVIQDVQIPIEKAPEFLDFYHATIRFLPVWVCPVRSSRPDAGFDLYPLEAGRLHVNFGFWDVIRGQQRLPPGYYNRQVEEQVVALGGLKSLYSDSYFAAETFWRLYNRPAYDRLKQAYDPDGRLGDLYRKCVLGE